MLVNSKFPILCLVISFICFVIFGCAPKAARKPLQLPYIPKEISRGAGKEPRIKVFVAQEGQIREMPLEKYVEAVVAGEMKSSFSAEALAAQAILARTHALEFVAEHKHSTVNPAADISTSFEEAQAWAPENVNDRIRQAVSRTRGKVVVYNGRYIKAWFHAHAGGLTAKAKEGLNYKYAEPPYTRVVKSAEGPGAPKDYAAWRAVFDKQEVINAVQSLGTAPRNFNTIDIVQKGPSGRATRIRVGGVEVPAPDLRKALDSTRMKSTLLTGARVEDNKVVFEGKGFGHGVGMSQWGAEELARRGKKAEDIIRYYYKDVDIVKIW
ncbi:MAG: SpoIID/LytB domain-containing protein [Bacillota bacterium]